MNIFAKIAYASLATIALGGCATKSWVQEYVQESISPVKASVNQVDSRVTQVAAQTGEARRVADDGTRKADKANAKADAANAHVSKAIANRGKRTLVETVALHYAPAKFALQQDHMKVLDEVRQKLASNPNYTVDIVAQADAQGGKNANYVLSLKRQEHVRRYLSRQGNGEMLHRISFISFGEDLATTGDGGMPSNQAEHRKVTVAIYRPDMD